MRWRRRRRFILPRALAQRLGDHLTLPPKTTLKEGPLSFSTLVNDSCTNRAGNSEHPALAGCFSSNRPLTQAAPKSGPWAGLSPSHA